MKNIFKLFLIFPLFLHALIIEPFSISHRSIVNDIKIIDGKVYSVSNDNTLKIWDKSLNLLTTIYEKHQDSFGNLYTIESNDKYILTAGIVASDNVIFVHNKKNLRVVKILKNDFDSISKLKFNKNKTILAVVSSDGLVYFYDKNLNFLKRKSFFKYIAPNAPLYDLVFLDNNTFALVGWSGYVVIHNLKKDKTISKQLNTKLQAVDFANNKIYVGGYDGYLYVFNKNLKLLKKIFIEKNFKVLKITHSKDYVAVSGDKRFLVLKNDKIIFKKNTGFSKAIAIKNKDIYVSKKNRILHFYFDELKQETDTIIYKPNHIYLWNANFSLDFDDIAYNLIDNYIDKENTKTINNKTYSFKIPYRNVLEVYENNHKIAEFIRGVASGYRHNVVIWYKHYLISGGDYGKVYIYDVLKRKMVGSLGGLTERIIDMSVKGDILEVLDESGEIKLYNLNHIKFDIFPYLSIILYQDKKFIVKSNSFFYTNDIKKVVCLKPTKLNLIKTTCKPNKKIIEYVIYTKKPFEKKIKTIYLNPKTDTKIDVKITQLLNTSNYLIVGGELGDYDYFAINKKTKKVKKLPFPSYENIMADVLEKNGYIYVLLKSGNIYKFDKNFNFITKTTLSPIIFKEKSLHLDTYKNLIAFKYKGNIYLFDDDLRFDSSIEFSSLNFKFWSFVDDKLYFLKQDKFLSYDFDTKTMEGIDRVDDVEIKTPQNKFIVRSKNNYFLVNKDFKYKFLCKDINYFYSGKKYYYGLTAHKIFKFLDDKLIAKTKIDKFIDILAGIGEIDNKVTFVSDGEIFTFDFKTKKIQTFLKPIEDLRKIYLNKKYIIAQGIHNIFIYTKNLKLIKKIFIGFDSIYKVDDDKIYIKGVKNYVVNLKNFKIKTISKLPKKETNSNIYYSDIDNYIFYKSFYTKAKETINKIYETDKYIIAIDIKNHIYIYDKKLNLIKKITLNKRAWGINVDKNNTIYYTIYDKIFKYNIK